MSGPPLPAGRVGIPPSPLAALDGVARDRAMVALSRRLPGRRVCGCGATVVLAHGPGRRVLTVEADPIDGGDLALDLDRAGLLHAAPISRGQHHAAAATGTALFREHRSCSDSRARGRAAYTHQVAALRRDQQSGTGAL